MVFHNGSNYDYHFMIKQSAEEFEKQITCFVETHNLYSSVRKLDYKN